MPSETLVQDGKRCGVCGQTKTLNDFYRDRKTTDGRGYTCKSCTKAKVRDWHRDNPERSKANSRQWKQQNPERVAEASRRWARKNSERHNASARRWQEENAERVAATSARWYAQNRDQAAANSQQWRETNRDRHSELTLLSAKRHPEKVAARKLLGRAVEKGELVKPEQCEDCGEVVESIALHGHHSNYSKPLDVEWLCRRCHARRHPKALPE